MQAVLHALAKRQSKQERSFPSLRAQASCQTGLVRLERTVTHVLASRLPEETLQPFWISWNQSKMQSDHQPVVQNYVPEFSVLSALKPIILSSNIEHGAAMMTVCKSGIICQETSSTSVEALGADSLNAKCVKLCNTPS